jgi:hypothetical protein
VEHRAEESATQVSLSQDSEVSVGQSPLHPDLSIRQASFRQLSFAQVVTSSGGQALVV